ncbi:zinc finger, CCHC-type containing protein [Tanacetum coccineum]
MLYLFDPTPSDWCKTDAHFTDFASSWLKRLLAGSITTWEDLTTHFLAQFFPPGRTAKLRNDILMFQQHHEESLSEAWTRFKDLLQKVPHYGIDLWLQVQIFYDHVNPVTRRTIDQSAGGLVSNFMASQDARLSKFQADFKQQQSKMTNKIDTMLKAITDRIARALPSDMVKNPKQSASPVLSARSYPNMDPHAQTMSKVRSTPSQSILRNKVTPMMRKQKRMGMKKRTSQKISMSTPPHRPIRQLHSSPKKSSIQFILRITWIGSSII